MLKNETEEQITPMPAAQIRVTPEELAAAVSALEAGKQEAARHLESTVPIGLVVQEMDLEATPEEVWAQVQKQRSQGQQKAAAEAEARRTAEVTKNAVVRRLGRGWQEVKVWAWILFWCSGGVGLLSSAPHWFHHGPPPAGIHVSGDSVSGNYSIQGTGPQRDVEVTGDHDSITLRGDVRNLTVGGDDSTVTVIGSVESVTVDNDGNTVHWTKELLGKPVQPAISGDGNKVGLSAP